MESSNAYLLRQLSQVKKSLFEQGFLDDQFIQLEELQDDVNPNFVEEVVTLFFKDSTRLMLNVEAELEKSPMDFLKLDHHMHQFKGSSASIGAHRMKNECTLFREYCYQGNADGCMKTLERVKKEHAILKKKLENYFQLVRQVGPAERATRPN
ncbi:hypothetical protein AAC387_Pa05g2324 [Persea americana]